MDILVVGTGVIGTTYGWQLHKAGCRLTHLVRPGSKALYERDGLQIQCMDMRKRKDREVVETYRPQFIEDMSSRSFDLILVSVGSNQLVPVLELLKQGAGKADVLFLQNIRPGDEKLIGQFLNKEQYLFAYPFRAGGGKKGNILSNVIFGEIFTNTMIGEADGTMTERVRRYYDLLKKAGMNPKFSRKIIPYIRSHYVWAAATLGAYAKAGSFDKFVGDPKLIRESYVAMREAFGTCRAEGIDPSRIMPTSLYYFPLPLLVPFTRMIYRSEHMKRMFEGHVSSSPDEMVAIYR
ncbi:MAG: ketopantoate reductase family protein, partial [Clostridia bacterium]|nr:ketopantoate reductase family protein [Clostridia bacterium]